MFFKLRLSLRFYVCVLMLALCAAALQGCTATRRPVSVQEGKPSAGTHAFVDTAWLALPSLPSGWSLQGNFENPEKFPLHAEFSRHHGVRARMAAFRGMQDFQPWWVVDTRYAFASEKDAQQFLHAYAARLSEGHPLLDSSVAVCGLKPMLFGGTMRHPSTGTFFLAFVLVGTYRHYLFSFLGAVEIAGDPPVASAVTDLRSPFLQIFQNLCSIDSNNLSK